MLYVCSPDDVEAFDNVVALPQGPYSVEDAFPVIPENIVLGDE